MRNNNPGLQFCGFIFAIVVAAFLRGWVLMKLWAWFVVPTFGLHPLSVANALGVSTLIAMLTHQFYTGPEKSEFSSVGFKITVSIVGPLISLLLGWIFLQFR